MASNRSGLMVHVEHFFLTDQNYTVFVLIAVICGFRCHPYDIGCAVFAPKMISSWSSFHMMFWGFIADSVPEMYQDSAVELNHPNTVAFAVY